MPNGTNNKSLEELIDLVDTGWPLVLEWIRKASNKIDILPRDITKAEEALHTVQISTRSPMGAILYETGGLLIDNGWVRVLGSGSARLNRSMPEWNKSKTFGEDGEVVPYYLVADDVIGGFFAINGGALGSDIGNVYYLAQDNLEWESMSCSYSEFLTFLFSGDLAKFYEGFRWQGWQSDVENLSGDRGIMFLPPLFTKEGKDIERSFKKDVPLDELFNLAFEYRRQLGIETSK